MRMLVAAFSLLIAAIAFSNEAHAQAQIEVVKSSDVTLQPLNPKRGDASPQAGVLWGDIGEDVTTGTLLRFTDGFSSPPHIHNITYRAVVISGAIHNDDPAAEKLWMEPGSFWTQPAGEIHITAAKSGAGATAFLEILTGPYLVQPPDQEFENGELPINIEARNVVWLNPGDAVWIDQASLPDGAEAPQIAFLWGSPDTDQLNGTFLKLPAGYQGKLKSGDPWLRAVIIRGEMHHHVTGSTTQVDLDTGSYFGSKGASDHSVTCISLDPCILYIRTQGKYALASM